jgi:hypothetical protein
MIPSETMRSGDQVLEPKLFLPKLFSRPNYNKENGQKYRITTQKTRVLQESRGLPCWCFALGFKFRALPRPRPPASVETAEGGRKRPLALCQSFPRRSLDSREALRLLSSATQGLREYNGRSLPPRNPEGTGTARQSTLDPSKRPSKKEAQAVSPGASSTPSGKVSVLFWVVERFLCWTLWPMTYGLLLVGIWLPRSRVAPRPPASIPPPQHAEVL